MVTPRSFLIVKPGYPLPKLRAHTMRTAFPPQLINDETRRNLSCCDNDDTIIMLALALPFLLLGTVNIPPQYAREYSGHATALVDSLTANYNVQVPPHVTQRSARSVAVSEAGTDVKVQLRVFKVESVAAANGQMRLKVWLRQNWKDERLSWNESAWGGVGMVSFATDPENRMLWVPDLGVYNSLVPSDDSLQYSTASVYSDGSVFWSRRTVAGTRTLVTDPALSDQPSSPSGGRAGTRL